MEPLTISPGDLILLKEIQKKANDLKFRLGDLEFRRRQLESEMESIMPQFAVVEREYLHHFNRIRTQYGIPENGRINEETGAVE